MASRCGWRWALWMAMAMACGDASEPRGTKVDCAWFQEDNCYKRALVDVAACLDPGSGRGTLQETRSACVYPSGMTVTFHGPVFPISPGAEHLWNFEVATDEGPCMRYEETRTTARLETQAGAFVEEWVDGSLQLTCPDGAEYYLPEALSAFECGIQNLPGIVWFRESGAISLSLLGAEGGRSVPLFTCEPSVTGP